jgi:hypothetical protein
VALFDIRFGHDSAFERVCKAIQFGVMVGLAVESAAFTFEDFEDNKGVFQAISLILMVSRFVLALQYLASWYWLRAYKKAQKPIIAHIAILLASAFVLLGLSFAFVGEPGQHAFYGWWILFSIEALTVLFVSGTTSFLNFKRTNIIERLGLLTLIILGEGVMNLSETITNIKRSNDIFGADTIGLIISSVLIVYFLYMLYFDQIETEKSRISTKRSELWTLLHFPFHVCILLVVEGFGQLSIWRKITNYTNITSNMFESVPLPTVNTTEAYEAYANQVNSTLAAYWGLNFEDAVECIVKYAGDLDTIQSFCYFEAEGKVADYLAETYEVVVPESLPDASSFNESLAADYNVYSLFYTVYLYFFISAGLTLIFLALLFILGKRSHTRIEWISIGSRLFVGTALCLLAAMYADNSDGFNVFDNFFSSAWMVTTVMLAYGLGKLKNSLTCAELTRQ